MNKSILITGASSGLGEAMAREFAQRGYRLALMARRLEKLETLQKELQVLSPKVVVKALDVTQYSNVKTIFAAAAQELDGLDIVVVNSGVGHMMPVGSNKFEKVLATVNTNITGAVACIDAAVQIFQRQGHGHVVGISSVAAVRGLPDSGIYSASKAAISRYLEALRVETCKKSNIFVTELAPGYIDTPLNRDLASRPFVIPVEKGARILANKIERKVKFSYVPTLPWAILAPIIRVIPTRFLAP